MLSVRQDPKLREALGEAIRPQPEWWLNGDPYVNGKVSVPCVFGYMRVVRFNVGFFADWTVAG